MTFKRIVTLIIALLFVQVPFALAESSHGTEIVGTVPRLLTAVSERNAQCVECSLGNAVADAMQTYLGTDAAIVCGGEFVNNLLPGENTWDELREVFAEDRVLATATVTVKELRQILEAGLAHTVLDEAEKIDIAASEYAGFPQIAGFTLRYDVAAPAGERIMEIKIGGEKVDIDDENIKLTLAATLHMLEGGYGLPEIEAAVESNMTLTTVLAKYIQDGIPDYLQIGSRVYPMGTTDNSIASKLPLGFIVAIILVFIVAGSWKEKRFNPSFTEENK